MFDLFRSRDKAVRILLGALLLLVALSMLTYLIPSYSTGVSSSDTVVAEIGSNAITVIDVQKLVQNTMRGRQLPPDLLGTFVPNMVDQMITQRALAYEAQRLGLEVSNEQLAAAVKQYIPSLFPDGKFVGKELYASFLSQQNMSIQEFEEDLKRTLLITRLHDIALEGTIVTPLEIEQEYRKQNDKIKIEYVKLTNDKYKAEVTPSAEDMQNYFKANTMKYMQPEKKNLAILIADQAKLEASVNPTDADLQRMYNQNISQFRIPETVKVRHILLMTEGKPPSDDAKIKAQADDLLKQVKAGANFGELVKKYSEDPGSKDKGGEYSVVRGQMVPEFEQAAFTLKNGESEVVKTKYGYHVVQVLQHDQARVKPFEEAKAELSAQWKKQQVADMMQKISDRAQADLQKDPTHPETVAAAFNMQLVKVDNVENGKTIPEVGPSPDFEQAISTLTKGQVSQPVAVQNNKIVVAVVTDIVPARPARFDEVQSQVKDAIVGNRLTLAVMKHAQELIDKTKAMGGDLAKAAKSMGLEVKTSEEFTRQGSVDNLGPASYLQEGFSRPAGSVIGPISLTDATAVAKVMAHVDPDMSKLADQRATIRDQIKSQKARDRSGLFDAGVKEALEKQGKIKYHQDVIQRLTASYRSS